MDGEIVVGVSYSGSSCVSCVLKDRRIFGRLIERKKKKKKARMES